MRKRTEERGEGGGRAPHVRAGAHDGGLRPRALSESALRLPVLLPPPLELQLTLLRHGGGRRVAGGVGWAFGRAIAGWRRWWVWEAVAGGGGWCRGAAAGTALRVGGGGRCGGVVAASTAAAAAASRCLGVNVTCQSRASFRAPKITGNALHSTCVVCRGEIMTVIGLNFHVTAQNVCN
jgi:hypothetical protein